MGKNALPGGKGDGVKRHRRQDAHNSAPPAGGTNPLVTSAEALRFARSQKHNPLPDLKPAMLVRVLDAFEHGYIREAVLLWEKIAERDDTLVSVKPKREKAVSQLDRQIVKLDDSPEADEHEAVLKDFWNNVRCYNSYDRNERGGFRRLVKQMMTAVSFRYACHHIVWQPRPDGTLRATFEFVPLWQFENRTGRLRYLPNLSALEGTILADGEWMTTVGDGVMIACCIGYLAKRSAYNDWLIFSEKFSVPGVMGRTTGRKDSPEGLAMRAAVESFGHDWTAVIYGDDGTHQEPLKLIQAAGNPSAMPMPAVIERVDRKFATIYRGADLSTMSSNSGEGTGASLQEKEADILMRDDAEMISETLEDISRMVIEWHFGHGTEPKARVELVVPVAEDAGKVIENGIKLADAGADVSISALMDRAGLPVAKDEADRLGAAKPQTQDGKSQDSRQEAAANADVPSYYDPRDYPGDEPARPEWLDALADDMQPLGKALAGAMRAGDEEAVKAALRKLSASLPEFMETPGLEAWMEGEMAKALIGEGEEAENAYNPAQARDPKGVQTGGRWTRSGKSSGPKARLLKSGVKIDGVVYDRNNPAPPDLALAVAKKYGDDAHAFQRILYESGHQEWDKTVPGALEYRNDLNRRDKESESITAETAAEEWSGTLTRLQVSNEKALEIAGETRSFYAREAVSSKDLVFRGEDAAPEITGIYENALGSDSSRISESKYPLLRIELSNGSRVFEKVRFSNHPQVSSNAPRHYEYDYRVKSLKQAMQDPEFAADMDHVVATAWETQKAAWQQMKGGTQS